MSDKVISEEDFKSIYTAKCAFNADAFKRGARVQFSVFSARKKFLLILFAAAMVIIGAFVMGGKSGPAIIMIAAGCFIITGINAGADNIADAAIKSMNGRFPVISYYFGAGSFRHSTTPDLDISYSSVLRLVRDDKYLYIYQKDMTAFLIDKEKVFGKGRVEGFMEFMEKKTGKKWIYPMMGKYLSVQNIKAFIGEAKKDSTDSSFEGERLSRRH